MMCRLEIFGKILLPKLLLGHAAFRRLGLTCTIGLPTPLNRLARLHGNCSEDDLLTSYVHGLAEPATA